MGQRDGSYSITSPITSACPEHTQQRKGVATRHRPPRRHLLSLTSCEQPALLHSACSFHAWRLQPTWTGNPGVRSAPRYLEGKRLWEGSSGTVLVEKVPQRAATSLGREQGDLSPSTRGTRRAGGRPASTATQSPTPRTCVLPRSFQGALTSAEDGSQYSRFIPENLGSTRGRLRDSERVGLSRLVAGQPLPPWGGLGITCTQALAEWPLRPPLRGTADPPRHCFDKQV